MPPRKRGSSGRKSQPDTTSDRPAELTDTGQEADHNAEQARSDLAATQGPAEPVREYRTPRPAPMRAAGHILTERGWELDTTNQEG